MFERADGPLKGVNFYVSLMRAFFPVLVDVESRLTGKVVVKFSRVQEGFRIFKCVVLPDAPKQVLTFDYC